MRVAVVIAGGDPPDPAVAGQLPAGAYVVAADSGLDHAGLLGVDVDLAVGDFDSASPGAVRAAEVRGVPFDRHPPAKEATDLQLAMDAALAAGVGRIVVVGGSGGRLDHLLATALLLAAPAYAEVEVCAYLGPATVWVVRGHSFLTGRVGAYLSLLAAHGPAAGVTTAGLRYPLRGEDLPVGSTRGVSNEFSRPDAEVRVEDGALLAVAPGRR